RFFERSELAVMGGCPACGEDEVEIEQADWEPATPTQHARPPERAAEIRAEAERLLARYKVVEPPVDVERIAFGEGLRIVRKQLGESDGFVEDDLLTVNAEHARTRQRFTIAHELGHLALHADGTDENSEREADQFASAVLIPREMLRRAVTETPDLDVLRRRFNVSREALWIAVKDARLERKIS
ncbi:MAG: ImmA/IrrE family metallo-endopeptidase, partial [bacterium]